MPGRTPSTSGPELVKPPNIVTKRLGTSLDPDAECPVFKSFIHKIFAGDGAKIAFLQWAVGYTLTGRTSEQCLFVLIGTGANGKSTLLKGLGKLMGDYAGSIPMHTLMVSRFGSEKTDDLASLKGLRFVSAQEGEAGERLAEAKIKLMTVVIRYRLARCMENTRPSSLSSNSGSQPMTCPKSAGPATRSGDGSTLSSSRYRSLLRSEIQTA